MQIKKNAKTKKQTQTQKERYHTKQAEKNAGYCLDIAEYCRINGRDRR